MGAGIYTYCAIKTGEAMTSHANPATLEAVADAWEMAETGVDSTGNQCGSKSRNVTGPAERWVDLELGVKGLTRGVVQGEVVGSHFTAHRQTL